MYSSVETSRISSSRVGNIHFPDMESRRLLVSRVKVSSPRREDTRRRTMAGLLLDTTHRDHGVPRPILTRAVLLARTASTLRGSHLRCRAIGGSNRHSDRRNSSRDLLEDTNIRRGQEALVSSRDRLSEVLRNSGDHHLSSRDSALPSRVKSLANRILRLTLPLKGIK